MLIRPHKYCHHATWNLGLVEIRKEMLYYQQKYDLASQNYSESEWKKYKQKNLEVNKVQLFYGY